MTRLGILAIALFINAANSQPGAPQGDCLHATGESAQQMQRRRDALHLARHINTVQANQPGARAQRYVAQADLDATANPEKLRASRPSFAQLSFAPGTELSAGWELRLDVTANGYWFMIKDKIDPCGFAYVSNQEGVIYTAQHLR